MLSAAAFQPSATVVAVALAVNPEGAVGALASATVAATSVEVELRLPAASSAVTT
jgi:hypothetical protein